MPKTFGQIEQPEDAEVAKIVLVGAANAGKSTLINRLVGDDVTIVSARPQTTRTRIMASLTMGRRQLLFLDTPGIVSRKALRRVERGVVTSPWRTLSEADCAVLLLDAYKLTQKTDEVEKYLFAELPKVTSIPALLVVNKIDQVEDQPKLLETVRKYQAMYKAIVGEPMYISALGNVGVDELRLQLLASTRPGNWEFPANVKSDLSDLTRVEDLIRAEWFARLTGYMPYVVRQRNVGWKYVAAPQVKRPMLDIKQELLVSSGGEAKILLGAKGALLKEIALAANRTISKALGCRVRLHLQVVVVEDRRTRK
ncbi:P-loop containing nucleoside triphosphate hydrolase protein [Coemansia reversa NRRL 1564]|uniref:P-loop containing nucleoside triphosphate hydrolase protein n=1 Tax=Coemansia reversa (strain ATCC 12441 / NRRL 1564) TaxID=763665 RepID=A0A2G5BBH3_COERN|nr:P-loop containing nucleoside triphosphate hydrolase protein [Coemansia reversa NRRL 1564]|eukprot:PIA16342.1 P-loop containing nucleoside triphosphate hydrolase protein [Coemansia reversa NRRL 1564]